MYPYIEDLVFDRIDELKRDMYRSRQTATWFKARVAALGLGLQRVIGGHRTPHTAAQFVRLVKDEK